MHPTICTIGPFTIYSYGLALVAGFLLAVKLAQAQAKRFGCEPEFVFNFTFIVFIFGIIGARIFFIVDHLGYYSQNPLEVIMLQHGGLAWFGGMFGGSVSAVVYVRRTRKVSLYSMLDLLSPFVALAQAVGRIGCYLNGCCYGRESVFGLYAPAQNAYLIPTQLYSSFFLLIIFCVLRVLQDRPHKQGGIFYAYLMMYTLKRFCMEFFRADSPRLIGSFTIFHLLSVAVFVFAAIQLSIIGARRR